MPAAAIAAKSRPRSRARKKAIGAEVKGRPTSQPPMAGPQRRPARLAPPISAGVRRSLRVRLSRRYLTGATTTSVGEPLRKFSTFCTARRRPSRITSGVCPALCGDNTTLSRAVIGLRRWGLLLRRHPRASNLRRHPHAPNLLRHPRACPEDLPTQAIRALLTAYPRTQSRQQILGTSPRMTAAHRQQILGTSPRMTAAA